MQDFGQCEKSIDEEMERLSAELRDARLEYQKAQSESHADGEQKQLAAEIRAINARVNENRSKTGELEVQRERVRGILDREELVKNMVSRFATFWDLYWYWNLYYREVHWPRTRNCSRKPSRGSKVGGAAIWAYLSENSTFRGR